MPEPREDPPVYSCEVVLSVALAVPDSGAASASDVVDASRAAVRRLDDADHRAAHTARMLERFALAPEQYLQGGMFVYGSEPKGFILPDDRYPEEEVFVIRAFLAEMLARGAVRDQDNAMLFAHVEGVEEVDVIGIPPDPARDVMTATLPFFWY
jgi:hypothetical protein